MPRRKTSRKKTSARTGASFQPIVGARVPTDVTERAVKIVVPGEHLTEFEKLMIDIRERIPGAEEKRQKLFREKEMEMERRKDFSPRPTDKPVWHGPGEMGPARSLHIPSKKTAMPEGISQELAEEIEKKIFAEQSPEVEDAVAKAYFESFIKDMNIRELDELKEKAARIRAVFAPKLSEDTPLHYVDYAYAIQALVPAADATAAKITKLLRSEDAPAARYASSPEQTGQIMRFRPTVPMKVVDVYKNVKAAQDHAARLADRLGRLRPLAERAYKAALRAVQPGATNREKRNARDLVRALKFYMEKLDVSMPTISK